MDFAKEKLKMGREKRKGPLEEGGGVCEKKTKTDEAAAVAAEEEPTDEEVEEFYVILRRMKQAAEYFGLKKGISTTSLRAVAAAAADQEEEEKEKEKEKEKEETVEPAAELKIDEVAPAAVKWSGKGKEVVEENGLRLDLNIAVAVESDGR